jgi:hypothetical protein
MAFHMGVKHCQQIDKSASGHSERSWRHHAGGSLKVFEMRIASTFDNVMNLRGKPHPDKFLR